ncbi:hypothetical protein FRC19_008352 [Serendipita sp. 401]|nr:hypothetical protein FRC19_008352 [Serendipita sp. 401]KAG9058729.1 hypothetical protein FS842_003518 [Serendipita sp. 407]
MVIRRPRANLTSAPTKTSAMFDATQSSSCSSTPSPASTLPKSSMVTAFSQPNFYQSPYFYGPLPDVVPIGPVPSYIQPQQLHYFSPDADYSCLPPQGMLATAAQGMQEASQQRDHSQDMEQEPIFINHQDITSLQGEYITSMSENMQPLPVQYSADLPKRKGDRALARLHRSAVDPDRHFACHLCIQKFTRKSDLTRHIKRHAGQKDYPCTAPDCPLPLHERAFFRADARRRHWTRSPACEVAFYSTSEGIAWVKKNVNRRGVLIYRPEGYNDNSNDDQSDGSDSTFTE